ncbi:hypothetical protein FA95DRAFT_1553584 [Auriscalpium vulgare]|uniref:Uncharacterized protein n=1 Tax=Auriscalpium vulgare TaxID=40419 RepID=A0ACB8S814_9AGAM|nr:hypothetical protein FA95DRAFT_1553584 [Auriscalpium vulgare]
MSLIDFHSHRTQLVLTAAATAVATFSLVNLYHAQTRRRRRQDLEEDIHRTLAASGTTDHLLLPSASTFATQKAERIEDSDNAPYDDELVREQLARNYAFLGEEGMQKVRRASVVIVGAGGVGSWAAVMLARSGVSSIRLIDFDYVTLSSLNRHATATLSDVGTPKVECVARAVSRIARFVRVDPRIELWREGENGAELLEGADWVIDAIDNIQTKVDLLKYCVQHNIKVFSSMGAGAKADPTRVQIADISATHYDPLARSVRLRLRAALNGPAEIPVVYSTEVPGDVSLLPLPEDEFQKGNVHELSALQDFRVRILPVLGPLPAIFGLHITSYILCAIAGKPLERPLPVSNRKKLYERLWKDLLVREERIAGHTLGALPLSSADIGLLLDDFSVGRAVRPPHAVCARPALVRWDPRAPLSLENCVVGEVRDVDAAVEAVFGVARTAKGVSGVEVRSEEAAEDGGDGLVDAQGEVIARRRAREKPLKSSEEVWGVEAAALAQKRFAQAKRWREWALQ